MKSIITNISPFWFYWFKFIIRFLKHKIIVISVYGYFQRVTAKKKIKYLLVFHRPIKAI